MKKLFFMMFFAVGLYGMNSDEGRIPSFNTEQKEVPTLKNFADLLMQKDSNGNTVFHKVVQHEKNLKKCIKDFERPHHGETEAEHANCKAEFVKGRSYSGTFDEYIQHQRTLITETLDNIFVHVSERKYVDYTNDRNETPLYLATECAAPYLVQKFLSKGADPDKKCHDGTTPLELACFTLCNAEIAKLLIEKSSNDGIVGSLFMNNERATIQQLHAITASSLETLHVVTDALAKRNGHYLMQALNELTKKDKPDAQQEAEKQ